MHHHSIEHASATYVFEQNKNDEIKRIWMRFQIIRSKAFPRAEQLKAKLLEKYAIEYEEQQVCCKRRWLTNEQ